MPRKPNFFLQSNQVNLLFFLTYSTKIPHLCFDKHLFLILLVYDIIKTLSWSSRLSGWTSSEYLNGCLSFNRFNLLGLDKAMDPPLVTLLKKNPKIRYARY